MRTVLAWEDMVAARSRLDAAERRVGEALVALGREKVPIAQMVTLTGIRRPECARLVRLAHMSANAAALDSELAIVFGEAAPTKCEPTDRVDAGTTERADAPR